MAYKNIWTALDSGIVRYDLAYEVERQNTYAEEVRVRFRLRSYLSGSTYFGYNLYVSRLWLNGGILVADSLVKENSPNQFDIYTYYPSQTGWYTFKTKNSYIPGLRLIMESKNNSPSGDFDTHSVSPYTDINISVPKYIEPASPVSLSNANFNIEDEITIKTNRASTGFTHTAVIKFNGNTVRTQKEIGDSYVWDTSELYPYITTSNKATGTITLTTYNGSTAIGTSQVSFTANVINSNPIFSNFEYEDTNSKTLELTGNNQIVIKGYSTVKGIITNTNKAVAQNSAAMSKYILNIGDNQAEVAYSDIDDIETPSIVVTLPAITMYAQDSRKNSTPKSILVSGDSYKAYTEINIKEAIATRTGGVGTEVILEFNGDIWNNNFGKVENDIISCTYRYKKSNEDEWIESDQELMPVKSGNSYSLTTIIKGDLGAEGFTRDDSFDVEIVVADKLSTYSHTLTLGSGKPNIAVHKNGVAFGAPYDTEQKGSIQVDGLSILNLIYPVGSIYMSVQNVNPSNFIGGTWETWGSGKVPVGVDTLQTEFATVEKTGGEKTHTLTTSEMPAHSHSFNSIPTTDTQAWGAPNQVFEYKYVAGTHYTKNTNVNGDGLAHNNLQPYITCYMWKRTA